MNQKKRKTLITAISATAAGIICLAVLCFATPTRVGTPSKANGTDVIEETTVATTITTEISETTSMTTATTSTTEITTTSTSTTSTTGTSTSTLTSTETVKQEKAVTPVEAKTAAPVTTAEVTEAATEPAETQREYIVYKPSTHYIHKSTCHWVDSTCYEIESTENIECRKCSECNPNMEIITPYQSNVTAPEVSDYDYTLLCKIVASEYGGYPDVYERAKIVASVMNMVRDSRWPSTVEGVLDQTCAPWGFNKYNEYFCGGSVHYTAMADAVDYYFNNPDVFAGWTCNQWWGDGKMNHFRTV